MEKIAFLKRVLFWVESGISIIIVLLGVAIVVVLAAIAVVSEEPTTMAQDIAGIAAYFIRKIPRLVSSEPLLVPVTLFWVCIYIVTMKYFAQTALEGKVGNYLIPATLICLSVNVITGFTFALGGLASQGAGQ